MSDTQPTLERLPPAALTLFRLAGLIRIGVYGLLTLVAGFILSRTDVGAWAWLLPLVAVLLCAFMLIWYPPRAHQRWGWALREHDLLIAHGVLVQQLVSIPAGRIQHVDVHQGPIERALGLARLQVYTASGGGADGEIPGLARETADALREKLVRREAEDVV
ncbi:PH domain-containing protein [Pyxidicoccus xibeiensis]|uniref:PH domain-containing protein n=1 Tax=Pyxidicoccus xibeiensis TaxID=2906759 RepID=UPI0020A7DD6A|nr:PH domain-containing protein [Pyxidicoccus xibeiensis]MCP3144872.1 PH domain-containing protein [Pyxidicoccus xibeiensis]